MKLEEFRKRIKKDYIFTKYFNYFFALLFTILGIIFLLVFLRMAINSGFNTLLIIYMVFILISGLFTCIGIIGFINTPKLTEIHKISNNNIEQGKNRIIKVAQKLNINIITNESSIILCSTRIDWFKGAKDIIFFIDENNIYLNIQPSTQSVTYLGGYYSCKKFFKKIEIEFSNIHS